jgi:SAM-dependent methyltransferase/DNA-binding MarR family transcriptional regulator
MDALAVFLLGRTLLKIAEEAIHRAGFYQLPTSVRLILVDVFEHPNSSIGEITARTGLPQSHVSAAVARLRQGGALVTVVDPQDRRRTLVGPSPNVLRRVQHQAPAPIDGALAAALGTSETHDVEEVVSTLEGLAQRLLPGRLHTGPENETPRKGSWSMGNVERSAPESVEMAGEGMPLRSPHAARFDALYESAPAWDIGRPQPAFLRLADAGLLRGRVLDVGCGTGEHVLLVASLGLEATGIDVSPKAIELAKQKATARKLSARFLERDARELADFDEQFETVLDSGLFHVFNDEDRARFVEGLRTAVAPGGRYYLLCFSDRQPGVLGPRRVSQDEIRTSFVNGWRVGSIEPATMDLTISPVGALAWLAVITHD